MNSTKHPKVFISHASEDKERFVMEFATALRGNGVDAWVDIWEIKPGDKLVHKIFEDGIKNMDIFIIILSKYSIDKRWVREELDAGFVKRISQNTKIIPILIDHDIEVPEALKSTVWVQINNLDEYDSEFKSILEAIFDIDNKPAIGAKPAFATHDIQINGLTRIDSSVLKALADKAFTSNEEHLSPNIIKTLEKDLDLSPDQINDSLEILESHSYLKRDLLIGSEYPIIELIYSGIITYAENFIEDFQKIFFDVVHLIFNEKIQTDKDIAEQVKCKTLLIDAILNRFESSRYIKAIHLVPQTIMIHEITASGKRYFREVLEKQGY